MPRGRDCGMHPERLLGKPDSPCGRKDKHVVVMDHGEGYLMIGCSDLSQACRVLDEYVNDIANYRFFARLLGEAEDGRLYCCVWASMDVGATWLGGLGGLKVAV